MLEFHRKMLGDQVRNLAFQAALKQAIKPGESVVADIGSGTGFLGFLARQLGAKECHLYEHGGVLGLSRTLAAQNNITKCRFYHRHSTHVKKPVQADVIVSETLGNFALEEHILETLNDARRRYLKTGGTIIPCRLTQYACPVVTDRFTKEFDTWGSVGFGLDLSAAREMSFHNIYVRTFAKEDLLPGEGAVQKLDEIDFTRDEDSRRTWSLQWKIAKDVAIHGFAIWWEAQLVPGVTLSTSPMEKPTHWEQIFVPVRMPLAAITHDALSLSMTCDTRFETGLNITWDASLFRDGQKVASSEGHDLSRGQTE